MVKQSRRGPKSRGHKALKTYGKPADLDTIRAYLQRVKAQNGFADASAATVAVLLEAERCGLLLARRIDPTIASA